MRLILVQWDWICIAESQSVEKNLLRLFQCHSHQLFCRGNSPWWTLGSHSGRTRRLCRWLMHHICRCLVIISKIRNFRQLWRLSLSDERGVQYLRFHYHILLASELIWGCAICEEPLDASLQSELGVHWSWVIYCLRVIICSKEDWRWTAWVSMLQGADRITRL
jgi:hypothetical protein